MMDPGLEMPGKEEMGVGIENGPNNRWTIGSKTRPTPLSTGCFSISLSFSSLRGDSTGTMSRSGGERNCWIGPMMVGPATSCVMPELGEAQEPALLVASDFEV